ncbi:hypothetical protein ACFPM2_16615, partial [Azospirillum picis]
MAETNTDKASSSATQTAGTPRTDGARAAAESTAAEALAPQRLGALERPNILPTEPRRDIPDALTNLHSGSRSDPTVVTTDPSATGMPTAASEVERMTGTAAGGGMAESGGSIAGGARPWAFAAAAAPGGGSEAAGEVGQPISDGSSGIVLADGAPGATFAQEPLAAIPTAAALPGAGAVPAVPEPATPPATQSAVAAGNADARASTVTARTEAEPDVMSTLMAEAANQGNSATGGGTGTGTGTTTATEGGVSTPSTGTPTTGDPTSQGTPSTSISTGTGQDTSTVIGAPPTSTSPSTPTSTPSVPSSTNDGTAPGNTVGGTTGAPTPAPTSTTPTDGGSTGSGSATGSAGSGSTGNGSSSGSSGSDPSSGGSSTGSGSTGSGSSNTGSTGGSNGGSSGTTPSSTPSVLDVSAGVGAEDTPLALTITLPAATNGSTTILTVEGLPAGASLSAGVDLGNGRWTLSPSDLPGLTLLPPQDYNGTINLAVTAVTTDTTGHQATSSGSLAVSIAATADAPTLSLGSATGSEGHAIALAINAQITSPAAGETLSVVISGVPAGAVLSAGTDNGDGTWTLSAAQLSGLTITPPADFSGTLNLSVTATSSVNGTQAS